MLFVYRECCKTNKIWYGIDESGNPSKVSDEELELNDIIQFSQHQLFWKIDLFVILYTLMYLFVKLILTDFN